MEKIIVETKYLSNVKETLAEKMGQLKYTKKMLFLSQKVKIFELGQIRHVPLEKMKIHRIRNCPKMCLETQN